MPILKTVSVFFCILIIFLTLLGTDLKASVKLEANVLNNAYFLKIFIFGVSIMRVIVSLSEVDIRNRYIWLDINGKPIGIALTTDRENKDSILNYMSNPLVAAIDFKYFDFSITLGRKNNPFATAMALQAVQSVYASVVAVIKSRQDLATKQNFTMDYTDNVLKFDFFGIISLTLANIIFSFLSALTKKIKTAFEKNRRNKYDHRHGAKAR